MHSIEGDIMENFRLLIVTGMSGAGKTRAMQALEDMGYFCIDNLPPLLIPKFTELCFQGGVRINRIAMVVDIRGGEFFDTLSEALVSLKEQHIKYEILFIEASDEVLISRYKESRRSHPLAPSGRITSGLKKERALLKDLRGKADYIIDTSNLKAVQLKNYLKRHFVTDDTHVGMTVTVLSFGFKFGLPLDVDMVWDVRFLPNPFYVEAFRHKTGRVLAVAEYIHSFDVTKEFETRFLDMMNFLVKQYDKEGKSQLIVAVGCTGGMHRSVNMAELLGKELRLQGYSVNIEHRDMTKNDIEEDYQEAEVLGKGADK